MAKIKRIVVHCTGTDAGVPIDIEYLHHIFFDINAWRHWGYHALIQPDGHVVTLQPWPRQTRDGGTIDNATLANGAKGYNHDSLHVAYVGGLEPGTKRPKDTRTEAQKTALRNLIEQWKTAYKIDIVVGHRDLPGVKKACPCFDAIKEYNHGKIA